MSGPFHRDVMKSQTSQINSDISLRHSLTFLLSIQIFFPSQSREKEKRKRIPRTPPSSEFIQPWEKMTVGINQSFPAHLAGSGLYFYGKFLLESHDMLTQMVIFNWFWVSYVVENIIKGADCDLGSARFEKRSWTGDKNRQRRRKSGFAKWKRDVGCRGAGGE